MGQALQASEFKTHFLTAVDEAQSEGKIGHIRASALRRSADNPKRLARIQARVEEECVCCGVNPLSSGPNGAPDWAAIIEFIKQLLPLIAQLIALFGL